MIQGYPRHPSVRPGETSPSMSRPISRTSGWRFTAKARVSSPWGGWARPVSGACGTRRAAGPRLGLARVRAPGPGRLALRRVHRDAGRDRCRRPGARPRRDHRRWDGRQGALRRAQPGPGHGDADPVQAGLGHLPRVQRHRLREPVRRGGLGRRRWGARLHGHDTAARRGNRRSRDVRRRARRLRPDEPPPDVHPLGGAVRPVAGGEWLSRGLCDRLGPPGRPRTPRALRADAERGSRRVLERRDAHADRGVHPPGR